MLVARENFEPNPFTPWCELFSKLQRACKLVKESLSNARTSKTPISGPLFKALKSDIQSLSSFAEDVYGGA